MELFLLKFVVFFRPTGSLEVGQDLFDIAGIGLFMLLFFLFLANSASRKLIKLSAVDMVIIAFATWCIVIYLIYLGESQLRHLAKLLIPVLSYTIVKNILNSKEQYRELLIWMIVGFSVPVTISTYMIAVGSQDAIEEIGYWTQLPRWEGAYSGSHNMGHSMTLFLMILTIFVGLKENTGPMRLVDRSFAGKMILAGLAGITLYCLYKSQVRSAILGLLVFALVYLYFVNKKILIIGAGLLSAVAVITIPFWLSVLMPDVVTLQQGEGDLTDLGSGRPKYWLHNLGLFAKLPFDEQLAGVGIGNLTKSMNLDSSRVVDSHNDWLDVLMQTGIVGLFLFLLIQLLLLRAIMRLSGREKYLFLGMFTAVNVMMFVSNSYVWRIQVGHIYYMMLAFIEIQHPRPVELSHATVEMRRL